MFHPEEGRTPVIVSAARTATGKFMGSLSGINCPELGAVCAKEAMKRAGVTGDMVDEVIFGTHFQAGIGANSARQVALGAGCPVEVPAWTVNKNCGTGLKAINVTAQQIMLGEGDIYISGGCDTMSRIPYLAINHRAGHKMGPDTLQDGMLYDGLVDPFMHYHMGVTAENVARMCKITREQMDEFALQSHLKAEAAIKAGKFKDDIVPVEIKGRKGVTVFDEDETVRFGASSIGRDMAPRIAGRIHTGLTADCTRLDVDVAKYQEYLRKATNVPEEKIAALDTSDRNLKMTRPAFGGNVMATIVCRKYRPQMATVRPGVMEMAQKDTSRTGEIVKVDAGLSMNDMDVELLNVVHSEKKVVDITDAKVLVSGGRGVGSAEGYEPLRELAAELNGEVSSSRIGVDSGWIEKSRQVGQTGKTVHPNLYIACGISGAIQHLAGMEDSEFIIAINKDESCPMMKLADLGIQGDLHVIIPKLTEAIKAYRAKQVID